MRPNNNIKILMLILLKIEIKEISLYFSNTFASVKFSWIKPLKKTLTGINKYQIMIVLVKNKIIEIIEIIMKKQKTIIKAI